MGDGILKVIDLLGATVAALQAENEQQRIEIEGLRQALAARSAEPPVSP